MPTTVNEVQLIGFMGGDPEVRYLPSGVATAVLNVATTKHTKDKATGEKKERTEWHRCVTWGKNAEFVGEYLGKGSYVRITGELRNRSWEKDGVTRYVTEVVGRVDSLDRKHGGDSAEGDKDRSTPPLPDPQAQPTPAPDFDSFDDDIPF